ncbi:hypothetical protein GCK72_006567 [Caenorhabditis remanei]|uniref:Uncharacterized protein n=1 Tax=Caenorhabditis remanei TaxID=31234 RepID=A0A6A5HH18_CAERE|nr:hypothetical protein GCK72_006567 [Caenorhabditis remanei]KAF1766609.1 hypothetical protein GCK72_006567 [Caenorhabditis remanei]
MGTSKSVSCSCRAGAERRHADVRGGRTACGVLDVDDADGDEVRKKLCRWSSRRRLDSPKPPPPPPPPPLPPAADDDDEEPRLRGI